MSIVIVYPHTSGQLAIIYPVAEEIPISEIARKDVPAGVPFLLVDEGDLPPDLTFSAAWEADFSSPDGYGIGHDAWIAEQSNEAQQGVA